MVGFKYVGTVKGKAVHNAVFYDAYISVYVDEHGVFCKTVYIEVLSEDGNRFGLCLDDLKPLLRCEVREK